MKRTQRNTELLIALMEIAESEGLITSKERQYLLNCRELNEARELAKGLQERREGRE